MLTLPIEHDIARELVGAIKRGDVTSARRQIDDRQELAAARIIDEQGVSRTLLHVVADWPGHVPNGPLLVAALVSAGADVNAPVHHTGPNGSAETALHWAASSDDVEIIDALLDHGADIEAKGAVITGGTAMSDAVIFAQWSAARRLLERDANTTLWQAAALGLIDRVDALCKQSPQPGDMELTNSLWHSCRNGKLEVAMLLVALGADPNWIGHDRRTALDVAYEDDHTAVVNWLLSLGAKRADELER